MDRSQYWNDRYAAGSLWGAGPNPRIAGLVAPLRRGKALDLGAGSGRHAVWMATVGHTVTAVDISDVGIEQGRRLAADVGVDVNWVVADVTGWQPDTGYDLVLCAYLQLPADDRRAAHTVAVRALAPGGTLLVLAHHLDNLEHGVGGPQHPDVLFTEADLRLDFAALDIATCKPVLRTVAGEGDAIDLLCVATRPGDV